MRHGNVKRSWFEPDVDDTEFLEADFTDFRYPKHVHETFAIGVIEAGAQRFATRSGQTVMPARHLCVVGPGVVHWGWPGHESGWRYRMIYPRPEFVAAALGADSDASDRIGSRELVLDDIDLYARFETFHRRAARGERFGLDEQLPTFLRDLFDRYVGRVPSPTPCGRVARTTREFLHARTTERITIAELADTCGVSESHLVRSFTQTFGMSPYAYLLALRVERAKPLLADRTSIADVATACGFHDQSHFHRVFRRLVGVTPGRFVRDAAMSTRDRAWRTRARRSAGRRTIEI